MKRTLILSCLIFLIYQHIVAQTVVFKNASFEDIENIGTRLLYKDKVTGELKDTILSDTDFINQNIKYWQNCGHIGETPPDVLPNNLFGVNWEAQEGKYYLGMVTRDNGTWESIGQKLASVLKPDSCYQLSLWLMCSPVYQSRSRKTGDSANYNQPTRLRIWGGNNICDTKELLISSDAIQNRSWLPYTFILKPKNKIKSIRFEVYYTEGEHFYNGNILIDNISKITPCTFATQK